MISTVADAGNLAKLFDVIHTRLPDMNGINLVTAFHRVAKLASAGGCSERDLAAAKRHQVFQELFNTILSHVQGHSLRPVPCRSPMCTEQPSERAQVPSKKPDGREMPVQCLSIVAWSCAMLQIRHRLLFSAIAEIAGPRLQELKPYELSNMLWAFAKLSLNHNDLFRSVAARLASRAEGDFKVQCLSTMAWAFATVKRRNLAVFNSLAEELVKNAHEMKPQEISNTLWAFAKTSCAHAALFEALGDVAASTCDAGLFKPQEISNTAWAFATAGIHHPGVFCRLEAASVRLRWTMMPQNVANILWAFAKLRVPTSAELLPALLEVSASKMPQHKPQELSAIVWASSQMAPSQHGRFHAIAIGTCLERAQDFSCNGLANLAKAVSGVPMAAPELFVALLLEAMPRLRFFRPSALAALLQGAATALRNPAYAEQSGSISSTAAALLEHVLMRIGEFNAAERRDLGRVLHLCRSLEAPSADMVIAKAELLLEAVLSTAAAPARGGGTTDGDDDSDGDFPRGDFPSGDDAGCAVASAPNARLAIAFGDRVDSVAWETPKVASLAERFDSDLSTAVSGYGGRWLSGRKSNFSTSTGTDDDSGKLNSPSSGASEPAAPTPPRSLSPISLHVRDPMYATVGAEEDSAPWWVPLPAAALSATPPKAQREMPMTIPVHEMRSVVEDSCASNLRLARRLLLEAQAAGPLVASSAGRSAGLADPSASGDAAWLRAPVAEPRRVVSRLSVGFAPAPGCGN